MFISDVLPWQTEGDKDQVVIEGWLTSANEKEYIYIFRLKQKKIHILAVVKYLKNDNNISTGNMCLPCLGNV